MEIASLILSVLLAIIPQWFIYKLGIESQTKASTGMRIALTILGGVGMFLLAHLMSGFVDTNQYVVFLPIAAASFLVSICIYYFAKKNRK
jgi:hypothetical protein